MNSAVSSLATSPASQENRIFQHRPLLFVHIPKTAGSSFLRSLANTFGDNKVRRVEARTEEEIQSAIDAVVASSFDGVSCLTGHLWLHMVETCLDQTQAFTILRDPVTRVLSLYRFLRVHSSDHLATLGFTPDFSLSDFLSSKHHEIITQVNNGMTRTLSGNCDLLHRDTELYWNMDKKPDLVEVALANLEQMDFGVVEHMGATLELARHSWSIPFTLSEVEENVTEPASEAPTAAMLEQIRELNAMDLMLYERANKMFLTRMGDMYRSLGNRRASQQINSFSIFQPKLDLEYCLADVPGRQGFDAFERDGIAWIRGVSSAKIRFAIDAVSVRFQMNVYCSTVDYPLEAIALKVNRRTLAFNIEHRGDRWYQLTSAPFRLMAGVNELVLDPPLTTAARLLAPDSADTRRLSFAISSVSFSAAAA
jgi:hypothetical protein